MWPLPSGVLHLGMCAERFSVSFPGSVADCVLTLNSVPSSGCLTACLLIPCCGHLGSFPGLLVYTWSWSRAGSRGLGAQWLCQHFRVPCLPRAGMPTSQKASGAHVSVKCGSLLLTPSQLWLCAKGGPKCLAGSRKRPALLALPSPSQQPLKWGPVLTGGHGCTCRQVCQGEGQKVSFESLTLNHLDTVVFCLHSSVCG